MHTYTVIKGKHNHLSVFNPTEYRHDVKLKTIARIAEFIFYIAYTTAIITLITIATYQIIAGVTKRQRANEPPNHGTVQGSALQHAIPASGLQHTATIEQVKPYLQ